MDKELKEQLDSLTSDEKTLLKDTIKKGYWGDSDWSFRDKDGNPETLRMNGYCTNDAKNAGHFSGRKVSYLFRSLYKKVCPDTGVGRFISHCSDWWGDGSGDMLFIKFPDVKDMEEWARSDDNQ